MFNFFQNIFSKVVSLMASVIIAVGLVSVPEIPEQSLPIEQSKEEIVSEIEQEPQKEIAVEENKELNHEIQNIKNQKDEEQNERIKTLKEEIRNLESYLTEHYKYIPHIRINQNETLIDFLERQKKLYTETIEKAQKITNGTEALQRELDEIALIQKQNATPAVPAAPAIPPPEPQPVAAPTPTPTPTPTPVPVPTPQIGTEVKGIITSDTTWTLENSPYIVVGNIKIEEGVTLEIKPGVVIRFDGSYYLMIAGELKSKGSSQSFVTFTSNKTNPQSGDWETIEFIDSAIPTTFNEDGSYASGSIIQFTKIEYAKTGITYSGGDGLFIDNNIIQNNGVNSLGGGIHLANTSWSKITNNTIRNNSAGTGGGLYLSPFRGEIVNNIISNNSAMTSGGGISAEILRGKIENNTINDNKGKLEGGGLAINSWLVQTIYPQIAITGNLIKNNFAELGGGMSLSGRDLNLSSNTIENNTALGGGGIYYLNLAGQITDNTIQNNTAKSSGGGISGSRWSSNNSEIIISHNLISANIAGTTDLGWGGGGIFINDDKAMITNNVIKQNNTLSGNGESVFIYENGKPKINNNVIGENDGIYEIYNSTAEIDASNNWWGTTDTSIIDSKIYDYADNFKKGKVVYTPIATSEIQNAGVR